MSSGVVNFAGGNVSATGTASPYDGAGGAGGGGGGTGDAFRQLIQDAIRKRIEERDKRIAYDENLRDIERNRKIAESQLASKTLQAQLRGFDPALGARSLPALDPRPTTTRGWPR